ncbi:DUF4185 domain-containing protein [Niabella sp. CC-SYL272]|uniref:DUF4185 domain-containing protein n=1 Tax=Niabella agricola TaxID=2891571 RepID=UPI001F2971F1|nr:DUF4185 domain-containing protein [Niabella agricola]MCF3112180.1 DUF4185 domain-containing protein [Niabella agricola]
MQRLIFILLLQMIPVRPEHKDDGPPGEVVPYHVEQIARVTGATGMHETLPNPNQTHLRYNIGGTDLGIAWRMENGTVGLFFGDTYGRDFRPGMGGPGMAGDWRSNVLAFSGDKDLSDGLTIDAVLPDAHGNAKEVITSRHDPDCKGEHTMIPTAAIHAGRMDYVHCMNIHCWEEPGKWTTNYSALFKSSDNGKTWHRCPGVQFAAKSKFAQAAFAKRNGIVYMFGTPAGRQGALYLARVREADLCSGNRYEYWNEGRGWVKADEGKATPVIAAPAGEVSVTYNEIVQRWMMVYLDVSRKALVLRDSKAVEKGWSRPKILVRSADYPGLYGSFIYPSETGTRLYFLMSVWKDYNVFLMKADLRLEGS